MEFKITLEYWDESDQTFHTKEITETGSDYIQATDKAVKKLRADKNVYDVRFKRAIKTRTVKPFFR